ncbi:MAG: hisG [Candidatus Taylorbacteria bacterium]|nr:hisG [Candidatus Taylorbacteria bacterium]
MKTNKLRIALPAGSLKEATIALFAKAGFRIDADSRSYAPRIDDPEIECTLIRAQEIPRYVEQGKFDLGITGKDWIEENDAQVRELSELIYSKQGSNPVKLVLAVPEKSEIRTIEDLEGKTIATELVNVTKKFLRKNRIDAKVEFSWGATESKAPYLVDAIAELSDSGKSIRANSLRVIETILESTTRVIANEESFKDGWKRQKMEAISLLLKSALDAQGMVGLKLNIRKCSLPKILSSLPALRKPTISPLADRRWISLESILPETTVKSIIPELKRLGAEGIIEYPLNKIIY